MNKNDFTVSLTQYFTHVSHNFWQIGVMEEKQYDDAYTLQSVDQEYEEIFNFMAGMVPFIQKLLNDVSRRVACNKS